MTSARPKRPEGGHRTASSPPIFLPPPLFSVFPPQSPQLTTLAPCGTLAFMAHSSSSAKPTATRLLREMARLPLGELDRLACNLLVLRSAKRDQKLPDREANLLLAINRTLEQI